jgi:hypothetical protein
MQLKVLLNGRKSKIFPAINIWHQRVCRHRGTAVWRAKRAVGLAAQLFSLLLSFVASDKRKKNALLGQRKNILNAG